MEEPVFQLRGTVVREDGLPPSTVRVAVLDRDWLLHDLLGFGNASADGRFSVSFQRRGFNLEAFENERWPSPWIRLSIEVPLVGDIVHWRPVLDHAQEWPPGETELDVGTLTVPREVPEFAEVGLASAPGWWRNRVRYEPSDEDLRAAVDEVVPKVQDATRFRGLDGPVAWADHLDSELPGSPAEIPRMTVAGAYRPEGNQILLSRQVLERLGRDAVRRVLGHELVHRAQFREFPELASRLVDSARDLGQWLECMGNIEGYARYVEEEYLRDYWPLTDSFVIHPRPALGSPVYRELAGAVGMFERSQASKVPPTPGSADLPNILEAAYDLGQARYLAKDAERGSSTGRRRPVRFALGTCAGMAEAWNELFTRATR